MPQAPKTSSPAGNRRREKALASARKQGDMNSRPIQEKSGHIIRLEKRLAAEAKSLRKSKS